ncbi:MAG: hypothetical protein C5B49_13195 [Bdellovibrio sp.]|nr:MAG: hypothetical protein C5B49_13195 [Bdellovibrio sp.]
MLGLFALAACDKTDRSYSLLGAAQTFQQNPSTVEQNKVDILWVVDNSGSMKPFQQNLANNFNSFITNFVSKNFDFHLAVTTSDSYLAGAFWNNNPNYSHFRDGIGTTHTGYPIIDSATPNLQSVFVTNALQGDQGSGDERAFSSFRAALQDPSNSAFHRAGAFLAIIILSDEDDFSDPKRPEYSWFLRNGVPDHDYADPNLETTDSYIQFLDQFTGTTDPALRHYNVSAVAVLDSVCQASHVAQSATTIIGQRYVDLANKTNGVTADICSATYADALNKIQQNIIELSTQFQLDRQPNPASIQVMVNNVVVPNSPTNGWTYVASANSVLFHGTAVPSQGASITVTFDPLAPTN